MGKRKHQPLPQQESFESTSSDQRPLICSAPASRAHSTAPSSHNSVTSHHSTSPPHALPRVRAIPPRTTSFSSPGHYLYQTDRPSSIRVDRPPSQLTRSSSASARSRRSPSLRSINSTRVKNTVKTAIGTVNDIVMGRVSDVGHEPEKKQSCTDAMFGEKARKWGFAFIVAFLAILTIKDVIELCIEYSGDPKQSDMNIVFNDSMTMPNVTFCMSKKQAWSHFKLNASEPTTEWDAIVDEHLANMTGHDEFLSKPWDFRMVMEAYDMIATYNSLERETDAHGSARTINLFRVSPRLAGKRKLFRKWLDVLDERKVTFAEFTQKTGVEVMRRSMQRFQRTTFDEDLVIKTKLRVSWISQMQLCFQPEFDEDNFKSIEDQGNFFTMMLSHNADNLNGESLECMSVDFHGRPSSLNRFMEGKGRARDGFTFELCAGQRHEVTVEVRALYQMLENDDEGTRCREVEDGEDTEFDCRSRCRMDMIRDMCQCTALSLSHLAKDDLDQFPLCDYTKCEIDVQKGNYSDKDCSDKCFRDCTQIRYEIDHELQGRMVRPDLTLINLNWGSFEYLTMEQEWVWSIPTFIAALGGSIGMWLGLSILSLIQGGTYLYNYLSKNVIKKRLLKMDVENEAGKRRDSRLSDMQMETSRKTSSAIIAANPFANPYEEPAAPAKSSRKSSLNSTGAPPSFSMNPNGNTKIQVD